VKPDAPEPRAKASSFSFNEEGLFCRKASAKPRSSPMLQMHDDEIGNADAGPASASLPPFMSGLLTTCRLTIWNLELSGRNARGLRWD